jgi:CRISPR-associated protein Cmr2
MLNGRLNTRIKYSILKIQINKMSGNYLALTIGPVTKTLEKAKTTRELWVASYFLSKLAEICISYPINGAEVLSPSKVSGDTFGAGVYPDRVYWATDRLYSGSEIEQFNKGIIQKLSVATSTQLSETELMAYLRIYWVQGSWTEEELNKVPFLFRLNDTLDGLELQESWELINQTDIITKLIAKGSANRPVYTWRKESGQIALLPYALVDRFPSITEIATRPLSQYPSHKDWYKTNITEEISNKLSELDIIEKDTTKTDQEKKLLKKMLDDGTLLQQIKDKYNEKGKDKLFFARHKYYCIIISDGDGVGAYLKNKVQNDKERLRLFSDNLNQISVSTGKMVADYGAVPVYASGDDLLFFAPLTNADNEKKEMIFDLLYNLNKEITDKFKDSSITLSFGVSISYYKHPLAENLATAKRQLLGVAKKHPGKNYAAVKLQKHSGQMLNFGFTLTSKLYLLFSSLWKESVNRKESFLNSLMYKLDDQKEIISRIATDKTRLSLFFKENFNESKHLEYESFFSIVTDMFYQVFIDYPAESLDKRMERMYGALRFIHFLNANDTNE